jgi:integrase/recombinase XerD
MSQNNRKAQRLPKSLSKEEFSKLIKTIPEKERQTRVAFLLAFGAGLRISEIVGSVVKKESDGNYIPALDKSNFEMSFNPPQIRVYGKYSKERIVPIPKGWRDWMFQVLPIGLTRRTLERQFKRYAEKAKLDYKYTFHSLRHGFGTACLEQGVPLNHIQYLLGHSNLQTTSVYLKAKPQDALKSYEELF